MDDRSPGFPKAAIEGAGRRSSGGTTPGLVASTRRVVSLALVSYAVSVVCPVHASALSGNHDSRDVAHVTDSAAGQKRDDEWCYHDQSTAGPSPDFIISKDGSSTLSRPDALKIATALCFLQHTGLPPEIKFYEYVRDNVRYVIVDKESSKGLFAETMYESRGVTLFSGYFDSDPIMQYKRAGVLVHEARHLEMNAKNIPGKEHVVCRSGVNVGRRNCDENFVANWDSAGATSFEVMFYRKLYDESTLDLEKKDLLRWISYQLDNGFNNVDPKLRERFTRR